MRIVWKRWIVEATEVSEVWNTKESGTFHETVMIEALSIQYAEI